MRDRQPKLAGLQVAIHILHGAARVRERRGALGYYEAAIKSIDRAQGLLASDLRSTFLDDKIAVYHEAIDLALELGDGPGPSITSSGPSRAR